MNTEYWLSSMDTVYPWDASKGDDDECCKILDWVQDALLQVKDRMYDMIVNVYEGNLVVLMMQYKALDQGIWLESLVIKTFGKLLEDIHVTWTQFGKKRDKITTLHEVALKICVQVVLGDGVTIPSDAVIMNKRRHQKNGDGVRTRTINQAASGKLREQNTKESYALLEDLALYENGSWNDPRDFAKSVKEISLPQDVSRTSDRRLIGLENQSSNLMFVWAICDLEYGVFGYEFIEMVKHDFLRDIENPTKSLIQEIIILDPDNQPMWESAKTVAPTPNYAIIRPDVDDNFVINAPISLKEKMHEMRKNYNNRGGNPVSKNYDTLMCESHEENYIQSEVREILARERERKARTTLLMALPEDHLAKFHKITDAKEMWEAIKSRFGGNDESKKMHKYIIKQQFDGFSCSHEDANQKFLRSLPSVWSQVSLIMRTKPGVDSLSFDDLYNNLRVFESDVKGSTASSFSTQNMAFFDEFDLEEMDLKWQVAMISMRMNKFYKKTCRKLQFDAKEPVDPRESRIVGGEMLRTLGIKIKKIGGDLVNKKNLKLCNSGSDTKGTSFSKECKESYAKLKKLYDEQREQLGDASIEIQAYTQALKKVEAQLVGHQQNQLWYEEKIRFMKIDLDDKTDISVRDKDGLGYGDQMNKGVLSYENEVFGSLFNSRSSDIEDSHVNDRYAKGMHAVPPPMIGIYIPSGPDKDIDDS
ncbi:hypothetical protein Tco_1504219 [Tanacetum coccineum]